MAATAESADKPLASYNLFDPALQESPFEFNARFSGTTPIRAHFGFNEPDMTLRSYYLGQKINPPTIRQGVALRYVEEIFVDGVSVEALHEPLPRGVIHNWF